jgi:hypothetical protein
MGSFLLQKKRAAWILSIPERNRDYASRLVRLLIVARIASAASGSPLCFPLDAEDRIPRDLAVTLSTSKPARRFAGSHEKKQGTVMGNPPQRGVRGLTFVKYVVVSFYLKLSAPPEAVPPHAHQLSRKLIITIPSLAILASETDITIITNFLDSR